MDFFSRLLAMSLIPIAVSFGTWLAMRESEKEAKSNYVKQIVVVRLAKIFIWVTLMEILFFTILIVGMIVSPKEESLFSYIIGCCFILFGIWLLHYSLIWRIEVIKGEIFFLLRDGFGRKSKIFYADCTSIEKRRQGYIVHTKTKKIGIDYFYIVNGEFLISELQKHHVKMERNLGKKT